MEPPVWHNLVVRLWRDGDGLKVRFLASRNGRRPATLTLATSPESAAREFDAWLRSIDDGDRSQDPSGRLGQPPGERRDSTRDADAGSADPQTSGT